MKKFLSIFLCAAFILCLFIGCEEKKGKTESTTTVPTMSKNTEIVVEKVGFDTSKQGTLLKAAPNLFKLDRIAVSVNGKWGYLNRSGEFDIEPIFDLAYDFDEESKLALVYFDGKYGYINEAGEVIIDAAFEDGSSFFGGLAAVKNDGKYGYIDVNGDVVIDYEFDYAGPFNDSGLAQVRLDDKIGYINKKGEIKIDPEFSYASDFYGNDTAIVKNDKGICIIDKESILTKDFYSEIIYSGDSRYILITDEGRFGFLQLNDDGYDILEPQFEDAGNFSNGVAPVCKDNRWIFIDGEGKVAFKGEFEGAKSFNRNLAPVKIDGTWKFTDNKGNITKAVSFDKILSLSSEGLFAVKKGKKWGIMNDKAELVTEVKFDRIFTDFYSDGYIVAELDGKFAVLNSKGDTVIPPKFTNMSAENIL